MVSYRCNKPVVRETHHLHGRRNRHLQNRLVLWELLVTFSRLFGGQLTL